MISTCSLPATDCEGAGADVSLHLSLFVSPRLIQGSCGLPCKRVVLVVTRHAAAAHPHLPLDFGLGDADRRLVSAAVSHLTQRLRSEVLLRSDARPCFSGTVALDLF